MHSKSKYNAKSVLKMMQQKFIAEKYYSNFNYNRFFLIPIVLNKPDKITINCIAIGIGSMNRTSFYLYVYFIYLKRQQPSVVAIVLVKHLKLTTDNRYQLKLIVTSIFHP